MIVLETDRLILRHIETGDAPYILALMNDPDFVANIGDRGLRTTADAEAMIADKFAAAYARHGFGMLAVIERASGAWLGFAGLVDRDGLDHVDVGYAFLPSARGRGFALEAVRGVLGWAVERGIAPVVAIVNAENAASIAILDRVGLVADRAIRLPGGTRDVMLYIPRDMQLG